jgi:hypothetical protein
MTIRDPLSIESRSDDARVCLSAIAFGHEELNHLSTTVLDTSRATILLR